MKSIKLTEEQQNKLLNMCEALFPKYRWFITKKSNLQGFTIGNDVEVYKGEKPCIFIHWYEFISRYLVEAIQHKMSDDIAWRDQPPYVGNTFGWKEGSKWTMYTEFCFRYPKNLYTDNPIDWLYNEFLKLKL